MKRRLFRIIAAITALCITIFASGCDSVAILSFSNNFLGGGTTNNAPSGYTETLTYDVKLVPKYERIEKNPSLTDDLIEYDYSGTYTMKFSAGVSLPDNVQSSIQLPDGATYYKLETSLKLDAWYNYDGEYPEGGVDGGTNEEDGKTYTDTIDNTVYFLPAGHSFAPIYAQTSQICSIVNLVDNQFRIIRESVSTQTTYNKDSYKTVINFGEETLNISSEYDYKAVVDNTQLLFALRSVEVASGSVYSLPTVSPAYTSPQTLTVENESDNTVTKVIDGESKSIPVRNLRIYRTDQYNTGITQYALIKKTSADTPNEKSTLIEYAAPVITYGTYIQMGALVYSLTSIK